MRFPYCPVQRSVVRLRIGEKQVVSHRVVEDVGILGDDPDPGSQIHLGVAADIPAAETDLAAIGVPETQDQTYQRALARAAGPTTATRLPGRRTKETSRSAGGLSPS
jgi:hypothetical protein